jgi:Flp pilus assembly protein TadD
LWVKNRLKFCVESLIVMPFGRGSIRGGYIERGRRLLEAKEYEEALAVFDAAAKSNPGDAEARFWKGVALRRSERYAEAVVEYDEAIGLRPDYAGAHFNRAFALDKLGRYEEAATSYDRAIELEPGNAKAHSNRGVVLLALGRYGKAVASFDRALELSPEDAILYYNRACAYALSGRRELMLIDLAKTFGLDDKYREIAKDEADFDAFRDDSGFRQVVYPEEFEEGRANNKAEVRC